MTLSELAEALQRDVDELRSYITRRLARVELPADGELISSAQITRILRGMHRRGERLPDEFTPLVRGSRSVLEDDGRGAARRRRQSATRDAAWARGVRERELRAAQQIQREEERARDFAERRDPNYVPRPWGDAAQPRDETSDVVEQTRELLRELDHPCNISRGQHRFTLAHEPELFSQVMARRREAVRVLDRSMMQRLVCDVVLLDTDDTMREAMRRADEMLLSELNAHLDAFFDVTCPCEGGADMYAPRVHGSRKPPELFETLTMPEMTALLTAYTPQEAFEPEVWARLITMLGTPDDQLDLTWLANTLEDDTLLMRCLLPAELARAQKPMIDALTEHVTGTSGRGARITLRAHNENSPREFELFVGDAGAACVCITYIL